MALRCPIGCGGVESIPVYAGKDNQFAEKSSICRSAAYMGLSKDEEESTVLIKVIAAKEKFEGSSGEQNDIKSVKYTEVNGKVFEFVIKALKEECPNLADKKSFISFDEILKRVQQKKPK